MSLRTSVLVLVIIVACLRYCVHCQPHFFPVSHQDMLMRGQLISAMPGSGSRLTSLYSPSAHSPFPGMFGSGLGSPSPLGLLDKKSFPSRGQAKFGTDAKDSSMWLARDDPFSSIRLNPVPTSKGVSLSSPNEGREPFAGSRRNYFPRVFDSKQREKYSLDAPSTFEKPISEASLPDVNSPITLDLANEQQERVAYAKQSGRLPPVRHLQDHALAAQLPTLKRSFDDREPRFGKTLLDWERPPSLPPLMGQRKTQTTEAPSFTEHEDKQEVDEGREGTLPRNVHFVDRHPSTERSSTGKTPPSAKSAENTLFRFDNTGNSNGTNITKQLGEEFTANDPLQLSDPPRDLLEMNKEHKAAAASTLGNTAPGITKIHQAVPSNTGSDSFPSVTADRLPEGSSETSTPSEVPERVHTATQVDTGYNKRIASSQEQNVSGTTSDHSTGHTAPKTFKRPDVAGNTSKESIYQKSADPNKPNIMADNSFDTDASYELPDSAIHNGNETSLPKAEITSSPLHSVKDSPEMTIAPVTLPASTSMREGDLRLSTAKPMEVTDGPQPSQTLSTTPFTKRRRKPELALNVGGSAPTHIVPASPFEMMFGRSLKEAYRQTFGSLFSNLKQGPVSDLLTVSQLRPVPERGIHNSGTLSRLDTTGKYPVDGDVSDIVNGRPSLRLFGRK